MQNQPNRNPQAFDALNAAASQAAEAEALHRERDAIRKDSAEMGRHPTHITDGHYMAFQALISGQYADRLMLLSCFVNDQPGVLIVAHQETRQGIAVQPLFVALGAGMRITSLTGQTIYDPSEEASDD
jgi:hypothetical protein